MLLLYKSRPVYFKCCEFEHRYDKLGCLCMQTAAIRCLWVSVYSCRSLVIVFIFVIVNKSHEKKNELIPLTSIFYVVRAWYSLFPCTCTHILLPRILASVPNLSLKIVTNRHTISFCLSNVCSKLQCPAVWGKYLPFFKNETIYCPSLKIYITHYEPMGL